MKSRLVLIVCLMSVASTAEGQLIRGFGIKAGPVISRQSWDYKVPVDLPIEARWGLDAGVFIEAPDIPFVSVLGECHYTQKGFKITTTVTTAQSPEGSGKMTSTPRVDYLSLPILLKLRLNLGMITPYIIAGPRFDLLVSKSSEGYGLVYDHLKKNDVGASFGLGAELPAEIVAAFVAEIRYSPSFSKAYDNGVLIVKNQSLELLAGVRF
jgi:hypothetical protein